MSNPAPDPELALISALAATARDVQSGALVGNERDQAFEILGGAKDACLGEHPLPLDGFDGETAEAVSRALDHGYVDPVDHDW